MANRNSVIKWLTHCAEGGCKYCPNAKGCNLFPKLSKDILELLKEQEPQPVNYTRNPITLLPVSHCPTCGKFIKRFHPGEEDETKYCAWCGQAVKWDD